MLGCMLDVLDSRLNVESEEGRAKELAVATASILFNRRQYDVGGGFQHQDILLRPSERTATQRTSMVDA
jgi:hypothetical protein